MATITISLPDPLQEWIEARIRQGDYASTGDYVRDLVRRDRERAHPDLTLGDLQRIVAESRASGISDRTVSDIFADAKSTVRARGLRQE